MEHNLNFHVIGLLFLFLGILILLKKPKRPSSFFEPKELSRERIIALIRGEVEPPIKYSGSSISVDPEEAYFANLRNIYALDIEMGAQTPGQEFLLGGMKSTATSSVIEQSRAGAVELRANTLRDYGIDLEELLDWKDLNR